MIDRLAVMPNQGDESYPLTEPEDQLRQLVYEAIAHISESDEFIRLLNTDEDGGPLDEFINEWIDKWTTIRSGCCTALYTVVQSST